MWTALNTYLATSLLSLGLASNVLTQGASVPAHNPITPPSGVATCTLALDGGVSFVNVGIEADYHHLPNDLISKFVGLATTIQDGLPVAPSIMHSWKKENMPGYSWNLQGMTQGGQAFDRDMDSISNGASCPADITLYVQAIDSTVDFCEKKGQPSVHVGLKDKPANFPKSFSSVFLTANGADGKPYEKSIVIKGFIVTLTSVPKTSLQLSCSSDRGKPYTVALTASEDKKTWTAPNGVEIKQTDA